MCLPGCIVELTKIRLSFANKTFRVVLHCINVHDVLLTVPTGPEIMVSSFELSSRQPLHIILLFVLFLAIELEALCGVVGHPAL